MCDEDYNEEEIDPRIQNELEKLNKASSQINEWENHLDELRNQYRTLLSDSTTQLNNLQKKLGSNVEKARPYFIAKQSQTEALRASQDAARRYDRACGLVEAAKEILVNTESKAHSGPLDSAMQEMLNHAVVKVNDAKRDCINSQRVHEATMMAYQQKELEVRKLDQQFRSEIKKARPYFEMVNRFNHKMQEEKDRVRTYEEKVTICKSIYSEALMSLDAISKEIHSRREASRLRAELGQRGEGVGAEAEQRTHSPERPTIEKISSPPIQARDDIGKSINNMSAAFESARIHLDRLDATLTDTNVSAQNNGKTDKRMTSSTSSSARQSRKLETTPIVGLLRQQLAAQASSMTTRSHRSLSQPDATSVFPIAPPRGNTSAAQATRTPSDTDSINSVFDPDISHEFDASRWQLEPAFAQPDYYSHTSTKSQYNQEFSSPSKQTHPSSSNKTVQSPSMTSQTSLHDNKSDNISFSSAS